MMTNRDVLRIFEQIANKEVRYVINDEEDLYFRVFADKLTKEEYLEESERRRKEREELGII